MLINYNYQLKHKIHKDIHETIILLGISFGLGNHNETILGRSLLCCL